ncbi:hypothetical protein [Chroococcidiopsis sp. TS-821]|nr:hypothetical protein [Chroococcidiopsis sp. TS-821]
MGQRELKGEIKTLSEKINNLDERVKNRLILAILGSLAKLFGFVGNT